MVVNMSLHKRMFQKSLGFSKTRKSRQYWYKTVSLSIKFEQKKQLNQTDIMSTFRLILNVGVS